MSLRIDESSPNTNEIWHPFWNWEELRFNMWGSVNRRKTWLKIAIEFTGDAELYGEWMLRVIEQWPFSCEHNLSKPGDKRAWVGHAAVALAIGCPKDIVREAWSYLNKEQQDKANNKAQEAIDIWRAKNAKA